MQSPKNSILELPIEHHVRHSAIIDRAMISPCNGTGNLKARPHFLSRSSRALQAADALP
jgi:hypothetical protein